MTDSRHTKEAQMKGIGNKKKRGRPRKKIGKCRQDKLKKTICRRLTKDSF